MLLSNMYVSKIICDILFLNLMYNNECVIFSICFFTYHLQRFIRYDRWIIVDPLFLLSYS